MDVINAEKLFAIKYCYKKSQLFLYNLNLFQSLIIFFFFTYWLSSQSHYFPPDTISSIIKMVATPPSFFTPSCLFVIVNFIVVYIVGEQKLTGAKSTSMNKMYDEYYIERAAMEMKYMNPCETMKQLVENHVVEEKEKEGIDSIEGNNNGVDVSEKENQLGDCELANEELNKRAEAFIARVNKQRKLEAVDCF